MAMTAPPRPVVNKPPRPGAFKGNPLAKAQLAGQRKNLAVWKAQNAKTPEAQQKFTDRAAAFGSRASKFTSRATKTPSTPSNTATNPGARTSTGSNNNMNKALKSAKRSNPAAAQKWLNRSVGLK